MRNVPASADTKAHWESVFQTRQPTEVSWYQPHLRQSLDLIHEAAPAEDAAIIDIGGGASTLVDDLLAKGFRSLTVLDISRKALEVAKARLGPQAGQVTWIAGDALTAALPAQRYDLWHDRALFHFLLTPEDQARYVAQVRDAVKPGGTVILSTFGPQAPPRCSGLEVVRYSPDALERAFGGTLRLVSSTTEQHQTPFGKTQEFVYCRFVKADQRGRFSPPQDDATGDVSRRLRMTRAAETSPL